MQIFQSNVLTLFPEMFPGPLGFSLAGKALSEGIWGLETTQIRDFATDKHKTVDGSPYGGGAGMVMRPDVLDAALIHAKTKLPGAKTIYFTPRGVPMTQALVHKLAFAGHESWVMGHESNTPMTHDQQPMTNSSLILLCGRFEGIDERVIEEHNMLEVSLGDFVLSGGEIAALALLDAIVRLLPGVMGNAETITQESFAISSDYAGLLEYPQYTRPPVWNGRTVPDVLLSGDHKHIHTWRLEQAKKTTASRRPDLIDKKKE